MKTEGLRLLVAAAVLLLCTCCNATLVNERVKRVIDITTPTAISRATITLRNTGTSTSSLFELTFAPSDSDRTHDVWATQTTSTSTSILQIARNSSSSSSSYLITLSSPISPGSTTDIDVRYDVTSASIAVPDTLSGTDSQYLRYSGVAYWHSPYVTETQTTTLLLASSSVQSSVNIPDPHSISSKRMTLGPYHNVQPWSHIPMSVRSRNDAAFLTARRFVKHVSIGHWRTIGVTEEYDVYNGAAKHVGEWSRVDHSSSPGYYKTAIGDVWANLPSDAHNVVYKDLIGNITTSRLRKSTKVKRALQLVFRYPLMGGWNNYFWFVYDLVHDIHVKTTRTNNGRPMYQVDIPLMSTLNTDVLCEDLQVRIVLPEWTESVDVVSHPSIDLQSSVQMERHSVTMFGRKVVTLKMKWIRSKSKHQPFVTVRYSYNDVLRWITPSLTIAGVFVVIVVALSMVLQTIAANAQLADAALEHDKQKTN